MGGQPHVWQRRFYEFNVWSERKRVEKLRYLRRNPVKEGLVAEPELWEGSSYAYQEEGWVKLNLWPKAVMKVRTAAAESKSYRDRQLGMPTLCRKRKGWATQGCAGSRMGHPALLYGP